MVELGSQWKIEIQVDPTQPKCKSRWDTLHKLATQTGLVFVVGSYINFTMMRFMLSGRFKTDIDKLIICEQAMNLLRELSYITSKIF